MADNKKWINDNTARIEALAERVEGITLENNAVADELETQKNLLTSLESAVDKLPIPKEIPTGYAKMLEGLDEFRNSLVPTYNKTYDTNENVTLYTPEEGFNCYYIYQRSQDAFRILWSTDNRIACKTTMGMAGYTTIVIDKFDVYNTEKDDVDYLSMRFLSGDKSNVYFSTDMYSTIEECINAIKNSSTTYTKTSNGFVNMVSLNYKDTQTPVIITNHIELGETYFVNKCGRQISPNENIVVIA